MDDRFKTLEKYNLWGGNDFPTGYKRQDYLDRILSVSYTHLPVQSETLEGWYVGPRREMITPWSTNAVEITQNMGLTGIARIEEYFPVSSGDTDHDPMLQRIYNGLNQEIFTISKKPDPIVYIEDLEVYNQQEGLALSQEEIAYLNEVSQKLGRKLTDSEVFGFSQVNSEHCRHKIFGGVFIIDGEEKESSLFNLIKKTSAENPNKLVSAYKDNVAFNEGPTVEQFAPLSGDKPDFFAVKAVSYTHLDVYKRQDKDRVRMYSLNPSNGKIKQLQAKEDVISDYSIANQAFEMVYFGLSASNSQRLYTYNLKNDASSCLIDLSKEILRDVTLGEVQDWNFVSAQGDTIYGHFYLPPHFDATKKYPMIVNYYGGTTPVSYTHLVCIRDRHHSVPGYPSTSDKYSRHRNLSNYAY